MGFTLLATLDEHGEFVSQFVLPVALTDEQVSEVQHGAVDYAGQVETYFVVDPRNDASNEDAVRNAGDFIAEVHAIDVSNGLFVT